MNCLSTTVKNSLEHAYAHHIQRLMITGNFALLAQTHPDAVDEWYLGIYADAVEWVQLPNTRGMSQYADGGMVATKPYVSSGSYVNKMSNYCSSCSYNHKKRLGDDACPFNSLYWNFWMTKRPSQKQQSYGNDAQFVAENQSRRITHKNTCLRNHCQSRCLLKQRFLFFGLKETCGSWTTLHSKPLYLTLPQPFWCIISNPCCLKTIITTIGIGSLSQKVLQS